MNPPQSHPDSRPGWAKRMFWCLAATLASALIWFAAFRVPRSEVLDPRSELAVVEVRRTQLELRSARLYPIGSKNPFNGLMVEHYPDGALRSRSAVTNGLLHGLSEGWHTNGQRQVSELFSNGVSQGVRTKWYPSGVKSSEASIHDGKLHGLFRRWHDNGTLAEQVEFAAGQPEGTSLAFFPNGSPKARVVMRGGKAVEEKFWPDETGDARQHD